LIQIETGVGLGFVKLIKQARETAREFELADDYDAVKDVKVVSAPKFCTSSEWGVSLVAANVRLHGASPWHL
jgi:hypothetical protein